MGLGFGKPKTKEGLYVFNKSRSILTNFPDLLDCLLRMKIFTYREEKKFHVLRVTGVGESREFYFMRKI